MGKIPNTHLILLKSNISQWILVAKGLITELETEGVIKKPDGLTVKIKINLTKEGVKFNSETDTEVIPQLFSYYFNPINKDLRKELILTMSKVIAELKGEFSFLLKYGDFLFAYKNMNPIIVGFLKNEVFISSDINLVMNNSEEYVILEDNGFFICTFEKDKLDYEFLDSSFNKVEIKFNKSIIHNTSSIKYTDYFMEQEILEQQNINALLSKDNLISINYFLEKIKGKKGIISGAGGSYYASMYLHYRLLECEILSQFILAAELKNYVNSISDDTLIVVFSQSGETADLIYPLKEISKLNHEIFAITNCKNSTLDRLAKKSINLNCGKEIAVASTKAFSAQVFFSEIIFSKLKNFSLDIAIFEKNFMKIIYHIFKKVNILSYNYSSCKDFFYLGRNRYYPLALEGALKLKEIAYIHAEGFAGGELKHGSLALIEKNIPCVILGGDEEIISNAIELKTRGAFIIGIDSVQNEVYDYFIQVPEEFKEIFSVIAMQIFALQMCLILEHNPDKPRNLAKSVTVK